MQSFFLFWQETDKQQILSFQVTFSSVNTNLPVSIPKINDSCFSKRSHIYSLAQSSLLTQVWAQQFHGRCVGATIYTKKGNNCQRPRRRVPLRINYNDALIINSHDATIKITIIPKLRLNSHSEIFNANKLLTRRTSSNNYASQHPNNKVYLWF